MKTQNYFRTFGVWILLGIMPVMVSAKGSLIENNAIQSVQDDSELKRQDDKDKKDSKRKDDKDQDTKRQDDKDPKKRPDDDKNREPKQEPKVDEVDLKRPNIKEVPRARPKLRPGIVDDHIRVKRPPVRVKPGRVLRSVGI